MDKEAKIVINYGSAFKKVWNNLERIIGLLGLIISIYTFVSFTNQLKEQNHQRVLELNKGIQSSFLEHPEMYQYFYEGVSLSSLAEDSSTSKEEHLRVKVQTEVIAEMYCDMFDRMLFTDFTENSEEKES